MTEHADTEQGGVADGNLQPSTWLRELAATCALRGDVDFSFFAEDGIDVTETFTAAVRKANPGWKPGMVPRVPPSHHEASGLPCLRPQRARRAPRPGRRTLRRRAEAPGPSSGDGDPDPVGALRRCRLARLRAWLDAYAVPSRVWRRLHREAAEAERRYREGAE